MKRNIIISSVFLLCATVAFGQSETSKTNSKGKTLKVEEENETKSTDKNIISKIKASTESANSNSVINEQKLIEKRKNLGVIELSEPEKVLTPEK